ncbi:hypothetical protein QFC22_000643 [Naganishia vaughanmartiniae]|uniref:Uncharacterized protein n=1 Tax=Naganishia vaughanmartiniae TaxID=1424756 RepID=A0ACC2XRP6_9TREE|nr:hypothetical protein QFC22_000643 [Naganishia vaughanmartiniae]
MFQGENSKRKMGVLASTTSNQEEEKASSTVDTDAVEETTNKDGTIAQDVMVPWVLQPKVQPKPKNPKKQEKKSRGPRGKGAPDTATATATTSTDQQEPTSPSQTTSSIIDESGPADESTPAAPQVFHRYYHLFVKGELRELVVDAGRAEGFTIVQQQPTESDDSQDSSLQNNAISTTATNGKSTAKKWLRVVEEGYEKDNWWLEGEVGLYPS